MQNLSKAGYRPALRVLRGKRRQAFLPDREGGIYRVARPSFPEYEVRWVGIHLVILSILSINSWIGSREHPQGVVPEAKTP